MTVVEAVLSLAGEDVSCEKSDILCSGQYGGSKLQRDVSTHPKSDGREFVILTHGKRQNALVLGLWRVKEEVLGIEAGATAWLA